MPSATDAICKTAKHSASTLIYMNVMWSWQTTARFSWAEVLALNEKSKEKKSINYATMSYLNQKHLTECCHFKILYIILGISNANCSLQGYLLLGFCRVTAYFSFCLGLCNETCRQGLGWHKGPCVSSLSMCQEREPRVTRRRQRE